MFLLLGIGALVVAAFRLHMALDFQRNALSASGTVVEIRERQRDDETHYRALVTFVAEDGKTLRFESPVGRRPGHYQVGETVRVLYIPGDKRVRIETFARLWGPSMVLFAMGAPLFLVGALLCLAGMMKQARKRRLQRHGRLLETHLHEVVRDQRIKKSGVHPYVIRCRWFDAQASQMQFFESESIWFDPLRYLEEKPIRVWQDRENPRKYHVDVSYLPTMRD